ncbi:MAG TPA: ThuA domain-containing protein [Longimicrobiales bacterium]|nr:ThuA domain-containing protein [Longimicrobiales bacterium]
MRFSHAGKRPAHQGHGRRRAGAAAALLLLTVAAAPAATLAQGAPKRLLVLTHAGLYRHASLDEAEAALAAWGPEAGFEVTSLEGWRQDRDELDLSAITAEYLARFDGVLMMTNGNLPMDEVQKRALVDFVRNGGGFVGVHNAALTFYDYPEFGEMLGGYFRRTVGQNRLVVLRVEDTEHPATRMLGESWPLVDEFYEYGTAPWSPDRPEENVDVLFGNRIPVGFSRDRVHVLLSIDTERTDLEGLGEVRRGGDYPQSWVREFGEGRSFYTSIGHRDDIWTHDPVFRAHLVGGIRWALGLEEDDATPR